MILILNKKIPKINNRDVLLGNFKEGTHLALIKYVLFFA